MCKQHKQIHYYADAGATYKVTENTDSHYTSSNPLDTVSHTVLAGHYTISKQVLV